MSNPVLQSVFNAALRDYEVQTGIKLIDHPLSRELGKCNSVDTITTFLQQQARNIGEIRGHDSKLMKSLKPTVNVLYILTTTTVTFREDIFLVGRKALRLSLLPDTFYTAMPTRESNICCFCHPTRGRSLTPFPSAYLCDIELPQAITDVSSSFDGLVDLFNSIGMLIGRLDIYTKIPPTPTMTEKVFNIMADLLSTVALATKQVMQGRLGKPVFDDAALDSTVTLRRKIYEGTLGGKCRRSGNTKVGQVNARRGTYDCIADPRGYPRPCPESEGDHGW